MDSVKVRAIPAGRLPLVCVLGACVAHLGCSTGRQGPREEATAVLLSFIESELEPSQISADEHVAGYTISLHTKARIDAACELLTDGTPEVADLLAGWMARRKFFCVLDAAAKAKVMSALLRHPPSDAEQALGAILDSHKWEYGGRSGVVEALWREDPERARKRFCAAVENEDWPMVHTFASVMTAATPDRLAGHLGAMLASGAPAIRLLAAVELAKRRDPSGLDVLRAWVKAGRGDDHFDLLGDLPFVCNALGHLYASGGRQALVDMLDDHRVFGAAGTYSANAALTLVDNATADDVPVLVRICEGDFNSYIRGSALRKLHGLDRDRATQLARRHYEKGELQLRMMAASILCRDGDVAAIEFLEQSATRRHGLGGSGLRCLLWAGTDESKAVFLRILDAATDGAADHVSAVVRLIAYSFEQSSLGQLLPVADRIASCGNEHIEAHLWLRLKDLNPPLRDILPVLRKGLERDEAFRLHRVLPCLENARIESVDDRAAAGDLLAQLARSQDRELSLRAAELGHRKQLVPSSEVRQVALECISGPGFIRALALLQHVACRQDLGQLTELLGSAARADATASPYGSAAAVTGWLRPKLAPVYAAIAVRTLIRRLDRPGPASEGHAGSPPWSDEEPSQSHGR